MGWLDRLRGGGPSADWPDLFDAPMEYDFDRHALCGVPITSPVADFYRLGRAEDPRRARKGTLAWYSRGFEIGLEFDRAMDFDVYFTSDWSDPGDGPEAWRGTAHVGGRQVRLDGSTTEQELIAWLGQPSERAQDEDSIDLRFARPRGITYDFELTPDGTLVHMVVTAEEPIGDLG